MSKATINKRRNIKSIGTLKREEFKNLTKDLELKSDFAFWLTGVGNHFISEKDFEHDLLDGIALCTVMSQISGSGVNSFHKVAPIGSTKAKENILNYQKAAETLNLPVYFTEEDLVNKNISQVLSGLFFLAHVAHSQNVGIDAMRDHLLDKIDEIENAMEDNFGPMNIDSSAQTIEESLAEIQRSMKETARLAHEDIELEETPWINSLVSYLLTVRSNLKIQVERNHQRFGEKVRQKLSFVMTDDIKCRFKDNLESLPSSFRNLLHVDALKDS